MPAADSLTATGAVVLGRPTATAHRLVNASLSDNTRRAYAGALGQLDAWLDGRRLDDAALAAYLAELHDAGCKPPDRCRYVLPEGTICPERPPPGTAARPCVREPPRKVCVRGAKSVRERLSSTHTFLLHDGGVKDGPSSAARQRHGTAYRRSRRTAAPRDRGWFTPRPEPNGTDAGRGHPPPSKLQASSHPGSGSGPMRRPASGRGSARRHFQAGSARSALQPPDTKRPGYRPPTGPDAYPARTGPPPPISSTSQRHTARPQRRTATRKTPAV